MPELDDFIDKVVSGNAGAAREQLQGMLSGKTADALQNRKQEITSALFNNGEEAEAEDDQEELEASEFDNDEIEAAHNPIEIDPFTGQEKETWKLYNH